MTYADYDQCCKHAILKPQNIVMKRHYLLYLFHCKERFLNENIKLEVVLKNYYQVFTSYFWYQAQNRMTQNILAFDFKSSG